MYGHSALAVYPAVEGAFVWAQYSYAATLSAGPQASPRAGPGGAAVGRFGWMNAAGVVLNARGAADDMRGLVLADFAPGVDWRRVFYDEVTQTFRIREGLSCPMLTAGQMWVRFAYGATAGQPVYANVLDGSPISGYSAAGELTQWTVAVGCAAGGLGIISSRGNYQ